ncbi:hypothetical protein CONPUDRAFT_69731 [Coniophora puteana RWD-64-598 SS2]|uniref:Uncharacterized protein n=1 Tax=Coniophora puteana (strain RWD-64-598) TaxID=741705 RepID=A0A5M3MZZ9_CONPW|nr:uncharacterized protein CONPUDRAFT_69731 [Coniophora puteana RWD-64-598 SS2]EIW84709.1 hypothetical protein CONPUDRAFT_69731 [Coniophora puteana RWD-64-598 SS2]
MDYSFEDNTSLSPPPSPSIASSTSDDSRPPSPSPSFSSASSTSTSPSTLASRKIRLVPSTLALADAVVIVPPAPSTASSAAIGPIQTPLLLVGPALERLRCPQRQLSKGARIHPYRIVRGGGSGSISSRSSSSSFA